MEIIEGTALAAKCDYSFGDHAMMWDTRLKNDFKFANADNFEFLEKAKEFKDKVMTLFIDNIRLYPRPVKIDTEADKHLVDFLQKTNNLLGLCSLMPANKFIIFTGQEDTPLDDQIRIPWNVERIYGCNALIEHPKITPIFFGVQRQIGNDNRIQILKENIEKDEHINPTKLLYINCSIQRNHERDFLPYFEQFDWATCHFDKDSKYFPYDRYQEFLDQIKNHKFMLCPLGHGTDCHRNLEALYLRRVPVMLNHPYFKRLYKDFPILYVDKWEDITPEYLATKDYLYQSAQTMDLNKLDLQELFNKAILNKDESPTIK